MKIIIYPESTGSTDIISFTVNHPKTMVNTIYFYESIDKKILEITKHEDQFRSWFIDDHVQEEGDLYILTEINPIYLILPSLLKKRTRFSCLRDILEDQKDAKYLIEASSKKDLSVISDIKIIDGEEYLRYNELKTIEWLLKKVQIVSKNLVDENINVSNSSVKIKGFTSGRKEITDPDSLTKYSFDLISCYLNSEVASQLRQKLCIKEDEVADNSEKQDSNNLKRKLENEKELGPANPTENYFDAKKIQISSEQKTSNLTRSQKSLIKDAKRSKGTKAISNYFQRKN